jgi:hypothetical protein
MLNLQFKNNILYLENIFEKKSYDKNEKKEIERVNKINKINNEFCEASLKNHYNRLFKEKIDSNLKRINELDDAWKRVFNLPQNFLPESSNKEIILDINDDYGYSEPKKHILPMEPIFKMFENWELNLIRLEKLEKKKDVDVEKIHKNVIKNDVDAVIKLFKKNYNDEIDFVDD